MSADTGSPESPPYANTVFGNGIGYGRNEVMSYVRSALYTGPEEPLKIYPELLPRYWLTLLGNPYSATQLTDLLKGAETILNRRGELPGFVDDFFRQPGIFGLWFAQFKKLEKPPSSFQYAGIIDTLRRLCLKPDAHFIDSLERNMNPAELDKAAPLSISIYSLAKLAVAPGEKFLKSCLGALGGKIAELDNDNLAMLAWSFCVFDVLAANPEFRQVAEIILRQTDGREAALKPRHMIKTAALWFDLPAYNHEAVNREKISRWQMDLAAAFREAAGRDSVLEHARAFVPELDRHVDMRMDLQGRDVIIEADGPFHFLSRPDGSQSDFDGSTCLQTALLAKFNPGAVIARLRYMDMPDLGREFFHGLTRQLAASRPGAYATHIDDGGRIGLRPFFTVSSSEATPVASPFPPSPCGS